MRLLNVSHYINEEQYKEVKKSITARIILKQFGISKQAESI